MEKMNRHKKRRLRLLAEGKCVECGKANDRENRTLCSECARKLSIFNAKTRLFLEMQGICVHCKKNRPIEGILICEECRKKRNEYNVKYRERQKAKREQ